MKVCHFCGSSNEDWMQICNVCGNPIVDTTSDDEKVEEDNGSISSYEDNVKVSNNTGLKVTIVVLLVILLILLVYTIYVVTSDSKEENTTNNNAQVEEKEEEDSNIENNIQQ